MTCLEFWERRKQIMLRGETFEAAMKNLNTLRRQLPREEVQKAAELAVEEAQMTAKFRETVDQFKDLRSQRIFDLAASVCHGVMAIILVATFSSVVSTHLFFIPALIGLLPTYVYLLYDAIAAWIPINAFPPIISRYLLAIAMVGAITSLIVWKLFA